MTLQTKQNHLREEIYPISLDQLVSRSNVGSDADIRLVGYTMSCQLATGNDCSTVSLNVAHSGPWVRRGDSVSDSFDQQFLEHTVAVSPKGCLFRKPLLGRSELAYLNPDTNSNFINLRVRDPCGVIPGVVIRIEFRAELIRPTPASTFTGGSQPATDRYEDQDVASGGPTPPSAVKHAPALIRYGSDEYVADSSPVNIIQYNHLGSNPRSGKFTVTKTTPVQSVSGLFIAPGGSGQQTSFNSDGYDGTITFIP